MNDNLLVKLDGICRLLAEAKTIQQAKHVVDIAEAARTYAKHAQLGTEAVNYAAEIKLRAERLLGEMLKETELNPGGRPAKTCTTSGQVFDSPTLTEIGITRNQSSCAQLLAKVAPEDFESYLNDRKKSGAQIITSALIKTIRLAQKETARANNTGLVADGNAYTSNNLEGLVVAGKKFQTIYADPPWKYGNQATRSSTKKHYSTMTVDEIAAMPVRELADENCHLHLWTTNAFLFESKRILDAWGFTYKSVFVWVKPQMGIGNYWRVSHEFLLLGVKGKAPFLDRGHMSWAAIDRTEHSAKPAKVRRMIESVSSAPRLELFGRHAVDGWTVYGDEIKEIMFDGGKRKCQQINLLPTGSIHLPGAAAGQ